MYSAGPQATCAPVGQKGKQNRILFRPTVCYGLSSNLIFLLFTRRANERACGIAMSGIDLGLKIDLSGRYRDSRGIGGHGWDNGWFLWSPGVE